MREVQVVGHVQGHLIKSDDAQQIGEMDDDQSHGDEPPELFCIGAESQDEREEDDHHVQPVAAFIYGHDGLRVEHKRNGRLLYEGDGVRAASQQPGALIGDGKRDGVRPGVVGRHEPSVQQAPHDIKPDELHKEEDGGTEVLKGEGVHFFCHKDTKTQRTTNSG